MESQVIHTVWCNISGEAAGEIWNWSLLGVKRLSPCQTVLPTRAKFTTCMELDIVWPPSWLELSPIFAQLTPSCPPFGHVGQFSPSSFVIFRWLRGRSQKIEWFSCTNLVSQSLPCDLTFRASSLQRWLLQFLYGQNVANGKPPNGFRTNGNVVILGNGIETSVLSSKGNCPRKLAKGGANQWCGIRLLRPNSWHFPFFCGFGFVCFLSTLLCLFLFVGCLNGFSCLVWLTDCFLRGAGRS